MLYRLFLRSLETDLITGLLIMRIYMKSWHVCVFLFLIQDEQAATELARIAGQFADQEEQAETPSSSKGDDLLAMMDDL